MLILKVLKNLRCVFMATIKLIVRPKGENVSRESFSAIHYQLGKSILIGEEQEQRLSLLHVIRKWAHVYHVSVAFQFILTFTENIHNIWQS